MGNTQKKLVLLLAALCIVIAGVILYIYVKPKETQQSTLPVAQPTQSSSTDAVSTSPVSHSVVVPVPGSSGGELTVTVTPVTIVRRASTSTSPTH